VPSSVASAEPSNTVLSSSSAARKTIDWFYIAIGFWSAHERPTLGLPDQSDSRGAGDRWSLIVIRDLMFGNRRHFRELLTRSEERIASNILADRLTRLEKAGLVSRRDDPSHKQKVIYSLTEASIALVPLLAHMGGWGLRHTHAAAFSNCPALSHDHRRGCGSERSPGC
jgi:DNA-binding HxlR family transcriptional regulator